MISVVTGASRGIGRAIALELARRGCDVALLGRDEPRLDALAEQLRQLGRRALAVGCDVARSSDVDRGVERVSTDLGVPQLVVANAGVVHRQSVIDTTEAQWDEVMDVNLKGVFLATKAFLPAMLAAGQGRIIAIGSISGTMGTPRLSAYCASKWGVIGFVKSLAEELRGTGLQSMCVLPGSVDTDMLRGSGFAPQMTAEDVARLVAWVGLDAPSAMSGACVDMFGP